MTINVAMLSSAKALNWTYGLYCTFRKFLVEKVKHVSVVGIAKLRVDEDASCIITHAYQPCLLQ